MPTARVGVIISQTSGIRQPGQACSLFFHVAWRLLILYNTLKCQHLSILHVTTRKWKVKPFHPSQGREGTLWILNQKRTSNRNMHQNHGNTELIWSWLAGCKHTSGSLPVSVCRLGQRKQRDGQLQLCKDVSLPIIVWLHETQNLRAGIQEAN